jgi:hypothetical protein
MFIVHLDFGYNVCPPFMRSSNYDLVYWCLMPNQSLMIMFDGLDINEGLCQPGFMGFHHQ